MEDTQTVRSAPRAVATIDANPIIIRDIETSSEMHAVEDLQRHVWGVPDLEVIPLTHLVAVKTAGGVLIGAFDGDALVGFVYGFPAIEQGRITHHSHMLAVEPGHRGHHTGERLKLAQRDQVRAQGIDVITWTFDPLQSLNAYLNFRKLGVVCDSYFVDFYSDDAASFLHQNGTDRLWVSWFINEGRNEGTDIVSDRAAKPLVEAADGDLFKVHLDELASSDSAMIEIPVNINRIERENRALAFEWRMATRRAFMTAIEAGFVAVDFIRGERCGTYVLERKTDGR